MGDETKIILTRRDAEVVFHAIENPREPSEGLKRTAERYKARYGKRSKPTPAGDRK